MTNIYINNVLQRVEILPANVPTKDETLETLSFALISNNNPLPLAPGQEVKIDFDGSGTGFGYFFLANDSVETCSLNPPRYKHTISCVQNTRKLSKHMVRNSSFTQPFYLKKSSFNVNKRFSYAAIGSNIPPGHDWTYQAWRGQDGDAGNLNFFSTPLTLLEKEKITSAKLKISFQYGIGQWGIHCGRLYSNDQNVDNIIDNIQSIGVSPYSAVSMNLALHLKYTDRNGVTQTRALIPSDLGLVEFELNGTYNFPLIMELAQQGCNNFEIVFDTTDLMSATIISDYDSHEQNYVSIMVYMVQVSIESNVYYYNCYDILELLIKRQLKTTRLKTDPLLFDLPESGELYELLKNTVAPNFTFTNLTMYECVAEVFRVFDAIFTMDRFGRLGIEYFNDLSESNVSQDAKFTGRTLTQNEDKYTNGLVADYQDARTIEHFPNNTDGFAHLRSAEFGVPESTDHNFIVPHGIDNIIKCEIIIDRLELSSGSTGSGSRIFVGAMPLDITDYVVDQDTWSSLATSAMSNDDFNNMVKKKSNTVYYVKGDNKIQLGAVKPGFWFLTKYAIQNAADTALIRFCGAYYGSGAHYTARIDELDSVLKGDWKSIKMRVTYQTSVNGKTKVHSLINKYPGEALIDQANGAVDLNKLGLNMLGLSLKLGNPTLNATHRITKWSNRIRTGQIYNWQGKLWVANVVNYTLMNGAIQGKVSFVENFNALSLRTQLLREKRMSNISRELVQKSEEIITDYIYFSSVDPYTLGKVGEGIHFNPLILKYLLWDSLCGNSTGFRIGDAFIHFNETTTILGVTFLKMIYIPMIRYGAGNTINFEVSYDHPMNAGNRTTYIDGQYFTDHVIYTDDKGFMEEVNVRVPTSVQEYTENFPSATMVDNNHVNDYFFEIANYRVYKQPNEIFALNYQLAVLPLPNRSNIDFVGNEFINSNRFVKDNVLGKKDCYIAFKEEKSSVLDVKATPYFLKKKVSSMSRLGNENDVNQAIAKFNFSALTAEQRARVVSWAIVDELDNILFASNSPLESIDYVKLYFITHLTRFN